MTNRNIAKLLLSAVLTSFVAQAAETVRWADVPAAVGGAWVKDRHYQVVTTGGSSYTSDELVFDSEGVKIGRVGQSIRREDVAEIRLHRDRRLSDALLAPAKAILNAVNGCNDELCVPLFIAAIPVSLAAIPAAAPVILPIEGIKRLVPDRVIRIAQ